MTSILCVVLACRHCTGHVELFRAEHGQVRKSLIQSLGLNRHVQDKPTILAEMLSVNDSGTIAGSKPQIADVVDLWIGKVLKDSSLFGLAMGLARVPSLGRYITCIAQTIGKRLTPVSVKLVDVDTEMWRVESDVGIA